MKRIAIPFTLGVLLLIQPLHANGGGYFRGGVENTGDIAGFEPKATENIRILDEKLTISLEPKEADVEVRYLMRNVTDKKVKVRFGFPVEESADRNLMGEPDRDRAPDPMRLAYCKNYQITASGKAVKAVWEGEAKYSNQPPFKGVAGWWVSEVTFAANEEKLLMIRFQSAYPDEQWSVSDNGSSSAAIFRYRLSSAACWAGTIGTGRIVVEPHGIDPADIRILKPVNRFQKQGARWVWDFENLEPTLADDIEVEAKPEVNEYSEYLGKDRDFSEPHLQATVIEKRSQWSMLHSNYEVKASSTLPNDGDIRYSPENIREHWEENAWSEGVPGPGTGEWLELTPAVAKPLLGIRMKPGYQKEGLFKANARPKKVRVELNGEHRYDADIADVEDEITIPVTGYSKAVKKIRLTFTEFTPAPALRISASPAYAFTPASTRNRMCSPLARLVWSLLAFAVPQGTCQSLPVFLSDNHAETFGWITRRFDPDTPYQLVLVDAHTDASAAERSEEIREGLRRVSSLPERADHVKRWREQGRIQAFNWIEPLMPRPLEHVHWIAATELAGTRRAELHAEAVGQLDGRIEVEPRSAGSFAARWSTLDLTDFRRLQPSGCPVILAIDLDFFAGMETAARESGFESIWRHAMDWPGLAGVAFAVSRPWLKDDAEADALVSLACGAVMRTRGSHLEIDASLDDRPDDSKLRAESGSPPARWDAANVSAALQACLLQMRGRLEITDRKRDWVAILETWEAEAATAVIHPDRGEVDCDGVWRFPFDRAPVLRLEPPADATGRVRWFALEHARAAYDLLPQTGLGKNFAESPGRWIYETRRDLGVTGDSALAPESWKPDGPGRVRVTAEIETTRGWIPVPAVELRLSSGGGFRGALAECFGTPYVFGIAGVDDNDLTGVETG